MEYHSDVNHLRSVGDNTNKQRHSCDLGPLQCLLGQTLASSQAAFVAVILVKSCPIDFVKYM